MPSDDDDTAVPERGVLWWIRVMAYGLIAIYYAGRLARLVQ